MQPMMMADVSAFATQDKKSSDRSEFGWSPKVVYDPFAMGVGFEGFHTVIDASCSIPTFACGVGWLHVWIWVA